MRRLIRELREAAIDKEELSRRTYPSRGYYVSTELASMGPGTETEIRSAYTTAGDYIGSPKDAYHLVVKRGIAPEIADPEHSVCSIGYCEKEDKWYGWSHRAISKFDTRDKAAKFAKSVS
jgi:hypothetical protein